MRIYLDDDIDFDILIVTLQREGNIVISPRDVEMSGKPDPEHLQFAVNASCALMSFNYDDYRGEHEQTMARSETHNGVLIVRRDDVRSHDMSPVDIARAIANLEASGVPIAGYLHILNAWQ